MRRTQLKRSSYRVLGEKCKREELTEKEKRRRAVVATVVEEEEYDEEVFDDTDFYQQLLREIIANSSGERGWEVGWRARAVEVPPFTCPPRSLSHPYPLHSGLH